VVGSIESKGRPGMGNAREESALNMFRQMDLKGKSKDDTVLKTVHQNTISTIRTFEDVGGSIKKFSSESYFSLCLLSVEIFGANAVTSERSRWQNRDLERLIDSPNASASDELGRVASRSSAIRQNAPCATTHLKVTLLLIL
jgi:hypothetical protein